MNSSNSKKYELMLMDPETKCVAQMQVPEDTLELEYERHVTMLYQELKKLIKRRKEAQPCE